MKKTITIGDVLLPLSNFSVSRNAILGITNSGKTYTAKGIAEQPLEAEVPIVVFDAIVVWKNLKTPGSGSGAKGFKVVVAGGESGDLPLTPKSAPEIVRAAIKENIPLVIDLYDHRLSKADWRRIVQESFRVLLYENKGLRHVFLEEAAEFAPQKVMDGVTYAEVEKLARMGGNKGIGITFINQRAQELNKAVLELCDNVVLMRQRGSHAIDALEKWLDRLSPTTAKEIANSMPQMQQGDCWVFTESNEVPIRTRSHKIHSFHPDRKSPVDQDELKRRTVDVDIFTKKLHGELGKILEEQKHNDPDELRKQIRDLKKQLDKPDAKPAIKEVPFFSEVERDVIRSSMKEIASVQIYVEEKVASVVSALAKIEKVAMSHRPFIPAQTQTRNMLKPIVARQPKTVASSDSSPVSGGLKRMMIAMAQREGLSRRQLGVRAGLSSSSGTFGTYLSQLRSNGWIEQGGDSFSLNQSGVDALGEYTPLPEGRDLLQYWLNSPMVGGGANRMLQALAEAHPSAMSREELGAAANISHTSGTFGTYLSKLRSLELVENSNGSIVAASEFFQ